MHDLETIEIPISKFKTILMLLGCLAFIIAGVCFVISPDTFLSPVARSSAIIFIGGCLGILFFGFVGFSIFKRVIDNSPGLIISVDGIIDNSSGVPAGFIPWSDIIAVKETVVANQRFINLVVRNPQEYIHRQKSAFKRKIMQKNYDIFGTAIGISANSLKIDYSELKGIIEKRVSDFKIEHNKNSQIV
jgi:hypothetical protein